MRHTINHFEVTSKGPRSSNQDYVLVEDLGTRGFFASVADGVGGNNGGEVASRTASTVVLTTLKKDANNLEEGFKRADFELKTLAQQNSALIGLATTLTCVVVQGLRLVGAHVGDSRVYILRKNGIRQLTEDQTEAAKLVRAGSLPKEGSYSHPYRNLLYSVLGGDKDLQVQSFNFDICPKDRIILMSDGVYSVITKRVFRDMSVKRPNFHEFFNAVVAYIEAAKPADNYSLVALEVGEPT